MSYETYPKSTAHPNGRVGETRSVGSWNESPQVEYKVPTVADTVFNGHKAKTLHCAGNSSSAPGKDYPKKKRSFGTEGFR
jgi:hypothetical protein